MALKEVQRATREAIGCRKSEWLIRKWRDREREFWQVKLVTAPLIQLFFGCIFGGWRFSIILLIMYFTAGNSQWKSKCIADIRNEIGNLLGEYRPLVGVPRCPYSDIKVILIFYITREIDRLAFFKMGHVGHLFKAYNWTWVIDEMGVGGVDLETYGLNETRNKSRRCLLEAEKRYM